MLITDLTEPLLPVLASDLTVQAAYLFGSHGRGKGRPDSDIDVAVMLTPGLSQRQAWQKRLELGAQLAQVAPSEVDLFILGDDDLDLTFRVLQQGKRIFERDRSLVRHHEARLVSLYYDYQPFLERYLSKTAEHFRLGG